MSRSRGLNKLLERLSEKPKFKASTRKLGLYEQGWKYCSRCMLFFQTNSTRCPYCGTILRWKPRKGKLKDRLREKLAIDPEKYGVREHG